MATVEGVHLRNSRYSIRILIPEELQASYSGKTRVVKALDTSDLREANLRGLRLRLQWLEEFDTKRKALNPQKLESITPELAQALAEAGRRGVLQRDQEMRDGKDGAFKALRKGVFEAEERQQHQIPRIKVSNSRGWPTPEELPELVPLGGISEWEADVVSEINTSRLEEGRGRMRNYTSYSVSRYSKPMRCHQRDALEEAQQPIGFPSLASTPEPA